MYTCVDPDRVCDPICDFCLFCEHNDVGTPVLCLLGEVEEFMDGIGYCDRFKCAIHEK